MTDKRLIDATEVERVFNQWLGEADSLAEQEAIECCIAHIHDTPAVDPKSLRGHARWVKDENLKIITVDVYGNTFESPVVHLHLPGQRHPARPLPAVRGERLRSRSSPGVRQEAGGWEQW